MALAVRPRGVVPRQVHHPGSGESKNASPSAKIPAAPDAGSSRILCRTPGSGRLLSTSRGAAKGFAGNRVIYGVGAPPHAHIVAGGSGRLVSAPYCPQPDRHCHAAVAAVAAAATMPLGQVGGPRAAVEGRMAASMVTSACRAARRRSGYHGGRDFSEAQHLAAVFACKLLRVGLLRKAADGWAHRAMALAAHHIHRCLGVNPVALGRSSRPGPCPARTPPGRHALLARQRVANSSTVSQKNEGLSCPANGPAPWGRGSRPAACRPARNWWQPSISTGLRDWALLLSAWLQPVTSKAGDGRWRQAPSPACAPGGAAVGVVRMGHGLNLQLARPVAPQSRPPSPSPSAMAWPAAERCWSSPYRACARLPAKTR